MKVTDVRKSGVNLILSRGSPPAILLLAAVALASCDEATAPAEKADQAVSAPQRPRFDASAVARAKQAIAAEAQVKDLAFDDSRLGVEWQVGVLSDGSPRYGFAEYLCSLLSERKLIDAEVDVRIVDIARVARGEDFRAASLGQVNCSTGRREAI
jgi:membrane-bound lytic murein transglycosylase B